MSKATDLAFQACEMIVDVGSAMMFERINAGFAVDELLKKHYAVNIQNLAKMAQDVANRALQARREESGANG